MDLKVVELYRYEVEDVARGMEFLSQDVHGPWHTRFEMAKKDGVERLAKDPPIHSFRIKKCYVRKIANESNAQTG